MKVHIFLDTDPCSLVWGRTGKDKYLGCKEVSFIPPKRSDIIVDGKRYCIQNETFNLDDDSCELIVSTE